MEILTLITEFIIPPIIIPPVMTVSGAFFMEDAPSEINMIYGCRTEMSMKNKDTWKFAHKFCGRIWFICGLIMLPASVVALVLLMKRFGFGYALLIVLGAQFVPLLGAMIATEIALRVVFDENGERKE